MCIIVIIIFIDIIMNIDDDVRCRLLSGQQSLPRQ
jgi:hypothetical protein